MHTIEASERISLYQIPGNVQDVITTDLSAPGIPKRYKT